jgi:hypothetical protein
MTIHNETHYFVQLIYSNKNTENKKVIAILNTENPL